MKGITPTLNQPYAVIVEDDIQKLAYISTISDTTGPVAMQVHRNTIENSHESQSSNGKM